VDDKGPEHSKEFKSIVKIDGKIFGTGFGKSKKIAEQNSAHEALKSLSYFKDGK
jgi:ribonuclease-3